MEERLSLFWHELEKQCSALNCSEFELYWEMWGVMWMPWFIEVNEKPLTFSTNQLSDADFDCLIGEGYIELVKVYAQTEMKDEFGRKRYKIIKR